MYFLQISEKPIEKMRYELVAMASRLRQLMEEQSRFEREDVPDYLDWVEDNFKKDYSQLDVHYREVHELRWRLERLGDQILCGNKEPFQGCRSQDYRKDWLYEWARLRPTLRKKWEQELFLGEKKITRIVQRTKGRVPMILPGNPTRCRGIYRRLALKLHPDRKSLKDEQWRQRLWQVMQLAQKNHSLGRLEMLLAVVEAMEGKLSEDLGYESMSAALEELKLSCEKREEELRNAKSSHAWRFAELKRQVPRVHLLRARVYARLKLHVREVRSEIGSLRRQSKKIIPRIPVDRDRQLAFELLL